MSSLIHDVQQHYSGADVVSFAFDYETVRLDKGDIKKKDIIYNYRYAGGDVSMYELTGKQLKQYMEWSADYFDTIQAGDKDYRYNAVRGKSKYVTFDLFGGVSYNIDLRNPSGSKIVDLKLANGSLITDDGKYKVGMNSYRFGQLTKKGSIWEGQ
ncbi:TPA: 5'-nucleotidase C-terminal domain-containing protein [Mannheimia haemolytica]|nr:5'-nucleotidase C-terminal domain-containing protein [Mannheimia haemolytica]